MFTLKELKKIRKFIDNNCCTNDKEILDIRDKLTDLIVLKSQWNKKLNLCDLN